MYSAEIWLTTLTNLSHIPCRRG